MMAVFVTVEVCDGCFVRVEVVCYGSRGCDGCFVRVEVCDGCFVRVEVVCYSFFVRREILCGVWIVYLWYCHV